MSSMDTTVPYPWLYQVMQLLHGLATDGKVPEQGVSPALLYKQLQQHLLPR